MSERHIIFLEGYIWGHCRPAQAMCIQLAKLCSSLRVTLVLGGYVGRKAAQDRERYNLDDIGDRFKVINIGLPPGEGSAVMKNEDFVAHIPAHLTQMGQALQQILTGQAIFDTYLEEDVFAPRTTPSLLIIDTSCYPNIPMSHSLFETLQLPRPPILSYTPYSTMGWIWQCKHQSPYMDAVLASDHQAAEYRKVVSENEDVIRIPGLAAFYAFEQDPSVETFLLYPFIKGVVDTLPLLDGVMIGWPHVIGGKEVQEHIEEWPVLQGNPVLQVGFALPDLEDVRSTDEEFRVEHRSGAVLDFLNHHLSVSGEKSVIYIGFGSITWHVATEHYLAVLDTLRDQKVPYLLSKGAMPPDAVQAVAAQVAGSTGLGLLEDWVPQWAVLNHPAVKAFISHGGSNSAMEALLAGVPTVYWPGNWDQPSIANEMTAKGVAYELFQIRQGHNIGKKSLRSDAVILGSISAIKAEIKEVLDSLNGFDGRTMRERAKALGELIKLDQGEGGRSHSNILRIIELANPKVARLP